VLFLIRHFSKNIAPWMDLFDHTKYFQVFVPALAQYNRLLTCAVAAVSAKHLTRIMSSEIHIKFPEVNWTFKSAQYYSEALQILQSFIPKQGQPQEPPTIPASEVDGIAKKLRNSYFSSTCLKERCMVADFVLAASCILSLYASLDSAESEPDRHLVGAKSLLDAALPQDYAAQHPRNSHLPTLCHAKRACFWFVAREDYLTAFSKNSRTSFDPYSQSIWENAGLLYDSEGLPDCSVIQSSNPSGGCPAERENLVSNILTWILCCIVNLISSTDDIGFATATMRNSLRLLTAQQLWYALDSWYSALPMEFEPYGWLACPPNSDGFTEVFFSKPSSAATMQHYHFARLLLLETDFTSIIFGFGESGRRQKERQIQEHSRDILSIAVGCPDAAALVLMVQPLFVAGKCLRTDKERGNVVQYLQSIETQLGWRTDHVVKQLLEYWAMESTA
ncbi:hypothetical protein EJ08DRAFT_589832, partial [Tothia fuscella]